MLCLDNQVTYSCLIINSVECINTTSSNDHYDNTIKCDDGNSSKNNKSKTRRYNYDFPVTDSSSSQRIITIWWQYLYAYIREDGFDQPKQRNLVVVD